MTMTVIPVLPVRNLPRVINPLSLPAAKEEPVGLHPKFGAIAMREKVFVLIGVKNSLGFFYFSIFPHPEDSLVPQKKIHIQTTLEFEDLHKWQ